MITKVISSFQGDPKGLIWAYIALSLEGATCITSYFTDVSAETARHTAFSLSVSMRSLEDVFYALYCCKNLDGVRGNMVYPRCVKLQEEISPSLNTRAQ